MYTHLTRDIKRPFYLILREVWFTQIDLKDVIEKKKKVKNESLKETVEAFSVDIGREEEGEQKGYCLLYPVPYQPLSQIISYHKILICHKLYEPYKIL